MSKQIQHKMEVPPEQAGKRIDQVLAFLLPEYSRSRLKTWLENGQIKINQSPLRPKNKVSGGELIEINAVLEDEFSYEAEAIDLSIIHEDDDILIIDKPVGMVVHPAAGNRKSTLLNALLHHAPELKKIPRAGIIHRLDKGTSGLLVIAKTLSTHTFLVDQLQRRKISREYEAIVCGVLTGGGKIEKPIGRHKTKRTHMAVTETGKMAVTHYRLIEKFRAHTYVAIKLETGRTHQIRVHFSHLRHSLVGDQTYGRLKLPKNASEKLIQTLKQFKHQALHAKKLGLIHPKTKKSVNFTAELPLDFQNLLKVLRADCHD